MADAIRVRFDNQTAREACAKAIEENWGTDDADTIRSMAIGLWHCMHGRDLCEAIADAINGGPAGGRWSDDWSDGPWQREYNEEW